MPTKNSVKCRIGKRRYAAAVATILVAMMLGLLSYRRNLDYRDPIILWESAIAVDPANPRAYLALGAAAMDRDRFATAEGAFRRSLELSHRGRDTRLDSYSNLAMLLSLRGQDIPALELFEKILEMNPDHPQALFNAAMLRFSLYKPGQVEFGKGPAYLQRLTSLLGTEHPRVLELRTALEAHTGELSNAVDDDMGTMPDGEVTPAPERAGQASPGAPSR